MKAYQIDGGIKIFNSFSQELTIIPAHTVATSHAPFWAFPVNGDATGRVGLRTNFLSITRFSSVATCSLYVCAGLPRAGVLGRDDRQGMWRVRRALRAPHSANARISFQNAQRGADDISATHILWLWFR